MAMQDMADEQEGAAEAGAEQGQGGYSIEIYVDGDGKISVGVESGAEEASEHQATGQEPERTPVKGIREALEIVMDIYKNQGQMNAGEDQFAAGFGAPPATPAETA